MILRQIKSYEADVGRCFNRSSVMLGKPAVDLAQIVIALANVRVNYSVRADKKIDLIFHVVTDTITRIS
jgi:hypothetical protein